MATLLRRRDEHDQLNNVSADVEANVNGATQPPAISPDSTLEEPGSKIWGPYLELADKYDKDLVHNWRDDMDSLLIFATLFSASVTAFVIESYKTLVQDSGDVTVDILLQISQQLANVTQAPITMRPPFQADPTDIAINVFWFLSLAFSLACALAAVLVRQWARQYLRFPRSFSSTTEQARARQFLFENVQWWKMDLVVEMIPALLHISLILFFIGLLLFAHTISVTLAIYILCFSIIGGSAYTFITIITLLFPGCPYKSPFSASIGLAVRIAQPPLKTVWTFAAASLACLIFILSLTLSALIRLFSPSAAIPEWKWTSPVSQSIRSQCSQILHQVRGTDLSLQGTWASIRKCGLNFVHFPTKAVEHTASSWVFTRSSLNRAFLSVSKTFAKRRELFRNDLSMRDAHALRWAMEFTKKDVDLFKIITSVPEFVQMHDANADVRLIMWNSDVIFQIQRLLHSSAINGRRVTKETIFLGCLESIIWSMPSATHELDEDTSWVNICSPLPDNLTRKMCKIELWFPQSNNKTMQTFYCACSNLLLRWIYLVEQWVLRMDEDGFRRNVEIHRLKILITLDRYSKLLKWPYCDVAPRTPHVVFDFKHLLFRNSISRMEFCQGLGKFRVAWVSKVFNISFRNIQSSSSFDPTLWNSLCDAATHLPPFPISTPESQEGIFMLLSGVSRIMHSGKPLPVERLMNRKRAELLAIAYLRVLFGEDDYQLVFWKAISYSLGGYHFISFVHPDFISRVHAYRGEGFLFQNSGKIVEIPFDAYCSILDDFMSSTQKLHTENQTHEARASTYFSTREEDLVTGTIQKFIRCRLRDAQQCKNLPIIVDARHLTVARFLLIRTQLVDLIERTAEEFGYTFQLREDYNLEMHAELQCYEPGIYGKK